MKLLISLAQTGSKHMILSTIELLWIGLVPPLLLLLITLARLLIKSSLKILRIGIRAAARAMKAAGAGAAALPIVTVEHVGILKGFHDRAVFP